ncbi:unnamed protein product [Rhodiola kirilowii]
MNFLKWVIYVAFVWSSLCLQSSAQACDPNDLLALQEFAVSLSNGSIVTSWSDVSVCCQWVGVVCGTNKKGVDGFVTSKVIKLVLSNQGLKGTISPSIGYLDQLHLLDLSLNHLQGRLPADLSNLQLLEVLDLSHNMLVGSVSDAFSGLKSVISVNISSNSFDGHLFDLRPYTSLAVLNVSSNLFSGELNLELCNSSNRIQILDMSMNHFTGTLEGIGSCGEYLKQLHLDSNSFSGHLPKSLFSIRSLEQLTVSNNNLTGQIGDDLSKLYNLRSLVIFSNRFVGTFPNVIGNLTKLEKLCAHSNRFIGNLPTTLAHCDKLQVIDLQNNSFSGPIGIDFSGLSQLSTVDFASNHLNGSLPNSLAKCGSLKILSLAKNELVGEIPEEYANLTSLLFISLSNNSFTNLSRALSVLQQCRNLSTLILTKNFHGEEIPRYMRGFENLILLALGNCALRGHVPDWLVDCKKLQVLDLSWNRLSGSIPDWMDKMENLFYLDLSNNSLSGDLPKSLTKMKSLISLNCNSSDLNASASIPLFVKRNQSANGLQYSQVSSFPPSIYLSNNSISGLIWPEVGRLKQLHVLDLSWNDIKGTIPESISEMRNLEILDLSHNNLHGQIPRSFIELTFLSKFSVAYNHLEGPIPRDNQFEGFPNSSFIGNPGLCIEIRSPCGNNDSAGLKPSTQSHQNKNNFGRDTVLVITITIGVGFVLILAVILLKMSRSDLGNSFIDMEEDMSRQPKLSKIFGSSKLVLFQSSVCKELTVPELLKATNNFNQANIIGCGGFGLVYKADLPNSTKVAVKRLSGDCSQMEREFQAEVEALSRAQHKNLVSLQGYCIHGNDRLLIYSYMENGSLDYWLHERIDVGSSLKWDTRLKIGQGAARGLAYLHKVCEPNIVHRDVKSSNILLDENFEAHLADFGLSRLLRPNDTHVTTDLVGTLGYIPPEYSQTLSASFRGDVYSFGVVLLELLTGRRPVEVCRGKNSRDVVSWVFQMKSAKREEEIIDPTIWDKANEKQFLEVLSVACKCIDQDPRRRPGIDEVVLWLDSIRKNETDLQCLPPD